MAEVIGIVASAITIGASAAQVSLALFSVVQTLKNAPQQIAEIAEEFSLVSESLQTLADVIRINQDVCRPALFKNTHTIISRYKQVDAEIKKLIDTPSKLAGLQWYLNKPKAKALLKKVEGIKTALILELNIIRLAKEEFTRPYSEIGPSTSVGLPPKFNRFRKVVESAVQANRKVVENAQQDDENAGTKEEQYTNVELDIWKHDSFDTATWLYHLVFSGDIPHPPEANAKTRRLHQASVADVSASSDEDVTLIRPATDTEEKAMIVWNKQTEPSSVVDRLLSSWTTLSSDQITRSAANQDGDEWREGLLKNLEEAKKADEKTFSQWELENEDLKSSEEDNLSGTVTPPYNIHNVIKNRRNRRERSQRSDPWSSKPGESPALNDRKSDRIDYRSSASRQPGVKRHVRWESDESSDEPSFSRRFRRPDYARPPYLDDETTSSRTYPSLSGQTSSTTSIPRPGFPNPFNPNHAPPSAGYGYTPPWQDPLQGTHFPTFDQRPSNPFSNQADAWANWASGFSPHYASVPPPPPPPPPPQPMLVPYPQAPSTYTNLPPPRPPEEQPNTTETAAKEKAVMKAVEDLLEKREQNKQLDASEPRFLKLMELFNTQKEHELENERERANAATEAQTKLMQAMHDKDEERLKQLETLVEELREEERHMRINWQVETEKQVKEARDTAAKEIAAVQSAREEAERQAQQRADARIATELRKLKRDHRKELKRYEDQMRELQEQQTKREQDAQLPIRRTRIAEGNRSVDVTEYSTDKRNPFHPSPSHLRGLQYGFAQLGINLKQPQAQHQYPDSFHSSTTSTQSSYTSIGTANTSNPSGSSQQLIVFPAKADRGSKKIAKLQSSLASLGIDAVFEDPEYELASQLVPYNHGDSGDHLVRSTIIWEAPMLSIGSELLLTMRQAGWRPAYTRISEKGHTHFLGNQPIHAYFFSPDYKPQFSQSTDPSTNESVLIHKSLVHEEALMELGFKYEAGDRGNYVLDGWVDYRDIEYLVERSFAINETRWRRIHRKLQGHFNEVADQAPKTTHRSDTQRCEADQPSMPSTPFAYSGDNEFRAFGDSNYDTEGRESSAMSTATRRHHHHHRDSDHSDRASTPGRDESSADSGSIISIRSTSSKNPFRQYMSQAGENKHVRGPKFASTTWNDEV